MKKRFIAIFVTCASARQAERVADALVRKRLVACASIMGGVRSKFWWKGRIERAAETLVIMKTRGANFAKVEKEVKRLHSYEVPEIIALPIAAGSKDYLRWIDASVRYTRASR